MNGETYHIPALLAETIDLLNIEPAGIYVDATFGGGGHSGAILSRLGPTGHLYGFDRDMDARNNCPDDARFTFVHSDYRYIPNFLKFHGLDKVDGILADLGVSFHHFDKGERGFSFREEAPLDMRMNQQGDQTAAQVIAEADRNTLTQIFRTYTDLKRPDILSNAIVKAREHRPIATTTQLVEVLSPLLNQKNLKKDLAQAFQAIRIEVNDEMHSLKTLLTNSTKILKPGGRIAIITYHSIEDRMVKNFFRSGNIEGKLEQDIYGHVETPWLQITRSPITPSEEEIERNPRSRSAKLRVAQKI